MVSLKRIRFLNRAVPTELSLEISDAAWQSILPSLRKLPSVREKSTWRALPKAYRYWNSVYRHLERWVYTGVFEKLHEHLHDAGEISVLLINSTIARAHSSASRYECTYQDPVL